MSRQSIFKEGNPVRYVCKNEATDNGLRDKDWCNCEHVRFLIEALEDARDDIHDGGKYDALETIEAALAEHKRAGEAYAESILPRERKKR